MEKYSVIQELGAGSFGTVYAALHKQTQELVAIKKLKHGCSSSMACLLPEVRSLSKLKHPNIVKLKEVAGEYQTAFLVFEYMRGSLSQFMQGRQTRFSEGEVRNFCYQIFRGLAYMHKNGYFHRDLKPDNLLVKDGVIKIGDLGSAREIESGPPFTDYVTTRWYRAPEVLLQSFVYGSKVDMWAMGAIMAELFALRVLFPGACAGYQMYKICRVIGTPTRESWPEGLLLAKQMNYQFPQLAGIGISSLIPSASDSAIKLISSLCSWDPLRRPTAAEALQHPFFIGNYRIPRAIPLRQGNILPAIDSVLGLVV